VGFKVWVLGKLVKTSFSIYMNFSAFEVSFLRVWASGLQFAHGFAVSLRLAVSRKITVTSHHLVLYPNHLPGHELRRVCSVIGIPGGRRAAVSLRIC
jgi:hypothetical protein